MKWNEYILKISSAGICIPEPMKQSHRYQIKTEIDITNLESKDNQDGTYDLIHKTRQAGQVEIMDELGKVVQARDKKSVSRSIHGAIWHYHNEHGENEDFDNYYYRIGKKMASYMPEIIKFLEGKN